MYTLGSSSRFIAAVELAGTDGPGLKWVCVFSLRDQYVVLDRLHSPLVLGPVTPRLSAPVCPCPAKHLVRPSDALCEAAMLAVPNLSVRMSEVTAAVLRPLLKTLPERVVQYNRRYRMVRGRRRDSTE